MGKRRHTTKLVAGALLVAALCSVPRLIALRASPPAQADGTTVAAQADGTTVRSIPAGTRMAGNPGKKGETYYWLESQTKRQTTRYGDATVVAERGTSGELHARVHDRDGNETATFTAKLSTVQFVPTVGSPLQAMNDSGERPTLDWGTQQAFALSTDGTRSLEWKKGLMRAKGAGSPHEASELKTEWSNGLTATVIRKSVGRSEIAKRRFVQGEVLVARLTNDGIETGTALWFVRDQVLAWDIPGVTKGWFGPEHLKSVYGGWLFVPDMAWLNLQLIAFHHFKTAIDKNGFVAQRNVDQRGSRVGRVANFFAPTLLANEPGCDKLHWLDGTVIRFCCDSHDLCYMKYGCTAYSWWQVWTSWKCDACNAMAVMCVAGAYDGPLQQSWW